MLFQDDRDDFFCCLVYQHRRAQDAVGTRVWCDGDPRVVQTELLYNQTELIFFVFCIRTDNKVREVFWLLSQQKIGLCIRNIVQDKT